MAGSDIRAGRAYVELMLKNNQFLAGLRNASQRLKDFGGGIARIGAIATAASGAVIAPIAASVHSLLDFGDSLDKMRQRTGVSVESLSELAHAAKQSGTDIDTVEIGIRKMQKTLVDANNGTQSARDSFQRLGLSVEQLMRLSPDEQFTVISKAIEAIPDPTRRAAAAMEVFGRSGTALLPMLESVSALREEARKMGFVLSGETAAAAVKLNDTIANVIKVVKTAGFAIAEALLPTLQAAADYIHPIVTSARDWVKENKELFATVAKVALGVGAFGVLLTGLGGAIALAGVALGGIATALATILSPVVLISTALAAGVGYWGLYTESGQSAISAILQTLGDFKTFALDVFTGISDALAAGDLALAGEVAMAGLAVVWQTGLSKITKLWNDSTALILMVANEASSNIAAFFIDAWANIQSVWIEAGGWFEDLFNRIGNMAANAFRSAQESLGQGLLSAFESTGILSAEEAALAREDLTGRTSGRNAGATAETEALIAARQAKRDKQLAGIEAERQAGQQSIEQGRAARNSEILGRDNGNAELTQAELRLLAARARAMEARNSAESARAEARTVQPPELPNASIAAKTIAGSFSAAALLAQAGGGGTAADRTAKSNEKILEETIFQSKRLEKIEKALETGGLMIA